MMCTLYTSNQDGGCSDVCLAPSCARSCQHEPCHCMAGCVAPHSLNLQLLLLWMPVPEGVACMHLQIAALKALKLNIRRAKVKTKGNTKVNKFFITDATTAEKIMKVRHVVLYIFA